MKNTKLSLLLIGVFIYLLLKITERFIFPVADLIAIPLLILAIILVLVGGFQRKTNNK